MHLYALFHKVFVLTDVSEPKRFTKLPCVIYRNIMSMFFLLVEKLGINKSFGNSTCTRIFK